MTSATAMHMPGRAINRGAVLQRMVAVLLFCYGISRTHWCWVAFGGPETVRLMEMDGWTYAVSHQAMTAAVLAIGLGLWSGRQVAWLAAVVLCVWLLMAGVVLDVLGWSDLLRGVRWTDDGFRVTTTFPWWFQRTTHFARSDAARLLAPAAGLIVLLSEPVSRGCLHWPQRIARDATIIVASMMLWVTIGCTATEPSLGASPESALTWAVVLFANTRGIETTLRTVQAAPVLIAVAMLLFASGMMAMCIVPPDGRLACLAGWRRIAMIFVGTAVIVWGVRAASFGAWSGGC